MGSVRPAATLHDLDARLADVAARTRAGDDPERVRAQLVDFLVPLCRARAASHLRRLPPGSDGAEVESRLLLRMWQTVRYADLTDAAALARLLAVTERGALVDAARSDDWLPRRVRGRLSRAARRVDLEEQFLGRSLSPSEAIELTGCDPREAEGRPISFGPTSDFEQRSEERRVVPGPEEQVVAVERARAVREWIATLPRAGDRCQLLRRLDGQVPIEARLARGIRERACRHGVAALAADLAP